jgi:hypothetical protein
LQTNLGTLKKRSTELTSLSNEISSFIESQIVLMQQLEMMSSNKAQNDEEWLELYLASVCSTSDAQISNLHEFLVGTFLVLLYKLAH